MKRLYTAARWLIVVGFIGIFSLSAGITPVQAGFGCANVIPITDGTDDDFYWYVRLAGDSLIWSKQNGELFHYHLVTTTVTQIGWIKADDWRRNFSAIDGNRIVWIDTNNQIQLYNVTDATTQQLTNDARFRTNVQIEGNYILWLQGKTPDKLNKLFVYNITTGTTTKIGRTLAYSLNEERVLWSGNLYDLATGINNFLGADYYTVLHGDYVLGTYSIIPNPDYPDQPAPQIDMKNLTTGVVTPIRTGAFRDHIYNLIMGGDYISWVEIGPSTAVEIGLYQISTDISWYVSTSAYSEIVKIDGQFFGYVDFLPNPDQDSRPGFTIYDLISLSHTSMFYAPETYSDFGDLDDGRIAWIEFKENEDDGRYDMQVILGTDCGGKPTITSQTPSLNILSGRSVDLSVTVVGDQPITYQWYQGAVGDTTTPLGDNSLSFTTPPLTETTSYWFQATNQFGTAETETITLTVGAAAELVVNGSFEEVSPVDFDNWEGYYFEPDCNPSSAHTGSCSARIEGDYFPQKLTQQLSLEFPYLTGDTLTLSAWIKANQIAFEDASVLLKVRYADDTKAKIVLKPTQTQFGYTQFTSEPITITGVISKAKVIIKYHNEDGDWWIDDVSLLHQLGNAAAIPLPSSGLTGRK